MLATATRPRPNRARSRLPQQQAFAGDRPLDPDETDLARRVVARLDEARTLVAGMFCSAEPTEEWLAALDRYREYESDDLYDADAIGDRDLLPRYDLVSYARFAAFLAEPSSIERAAWMLLRSAEADMTRLILGLNSPPDPTQARPNWISVDSRRFSYEWMDSDRDPKDSRLIEAPSPLA